MHPCRYSIPNATTYDNLFLISTQHSLHLYQPITLPSDYLTGQAAILSPVPLPADWKDHITPLRTPGLFGYHAPSMPTHPHRGNLLLHTSPLCISTSSNIASSIESGRRTTETVEVPLQEGEELSRSRPSVQPSDTLLSNRPPLVIAPRLASESLQNLLQKDSNMQGGEILQSQESVDDDAREQKRVEMESGDGQSRMVSKIDASSNHSYLQHSISLAHSNLRHSRGEIDNSTGIESTSIKKLAEMCPEYRSTMTIRSPHGLRFQSSFRISQRLPLMDTLNEHAQIGKEVSFNMPALDDMPSDESLRPGFFKDRILLSIHILGKEVKAITVESSCKAMADHYFNQKQLFGCCCCYSG